MDIDLSEYMGAYIDGSRENLDMMDKMLLNLEQNPTNIEAVGEIFRAAHTLKGMSATMGFEKIAHLTHEMENLLDKLRNQQLAVTPPVIDLIFETFDVLRTLVEDSINQTDSTIDLSEISGKLAAMANGQGANPAPALTLTQTSTQTASKTDNSSSVDVSDFGLTDYEISGLEQAKDGGKHIVWLKVTLVPDCLLKGPRVFMVMRAIEECQAEVAKSLPDVKDLENEKFDLSFKMLLISDKSAEDVKGNIDGISEIEKVETAEFNPSVLSTGTEPPQASAPAMQSQPATTTAVPPAVPTTQQVSAPTPAASPIPPAAPQTEAYAPQAPGYPQQMVGYPPQGQGYPQVPGYMPQAPGYQPMPGYIPQAPGYPPVSGYPSQIPGYPPQAPGYPPQVPAGYVPQMPGYTQQAPGYAPMSGYIPQAPGYPAPQSTYSTQQPQSGTNANSADGPVATPVSVPTIPTQPAIARPVSSAQQAGQQESEENKENKESEETKEVIGLIKFINFTMAGESYALEISQVDAIINLTSITRVPKAPSHIDGVINLRGEIVPVINTRRRLKLAEIEKSPLNQIIILSFEEEKVKVGFLVDSVQEVIQIPETAIEPPTRVSDGVDIEYLRGVGKIDNKIIILLNAHRIVFDNQEE